jgi:hypothetical protein
LITTYNIIKENCLEPDIITDLNIFDRAFILLALRKNVLGSVYKDTDFSSSLEMASTLVLPTSEILTMGEIKIEPQIPSLQESYEMELELRNDLQNKTITIDMLTEELIINSFCKFVKEIWVGDKQLNFKSFKYKERLTLIENLPATALNSLQSCAGSVTALQDSITLNKFYIDTDLFLA